MKPESILKIEEAIGIVFNMSIVNNSSVWDNDNSYELNEDNEVVSLYLNSNKIEDISFLSELVQLKELGISNNLIKDINPLKKLKRIKCLRMWSNQIFDITTLENLSELETLDMWSNQIKDFSALSNLSNLKNLDIGFNFVEDLSFLKNLKKIKILNLSKAIAKDFSFLNEFKDLTELSLGFNNIKDYSFIDDLTQLNVLNLNNNELVDISFLGKLENLTTLNLNSNSITDFSILSKLKKLINLLVKENQIDDCSFLNNLFELVHIDLSSNIITDISHLQKNTNIFRLNLRNNEIIEISSLENLERIQSVDISNNKINDISVFAKLKNIVELNLSGNVINDYSYISKLEKLKTLSIADNSIRTIDFLPGEIINLNIRDSQLVDITFLLNLKKIERLDISHNLIEKVSILKMVKSLVFVDLRNNLISNLEEFDFIKVFFSLDIRAFNNPCFTESEIVIESNSNNYNLIYNELIKLKESQESYVLPTKVMFLGNTKSGKSTLLNYLLQTSKEKRINEIKDSTHVLRIEQKPKRIKKDKLPDVVFYDFGGQDYYHGLYNAFMSKKSINIILWNNLTNKNDIELNDRNGHSTRNFNINYWLYQLKYFYTKDENTQNNFKIQNEVLFLVQTYADSNHKRYNYSGDCDDFNLLNEFYLSLKQLGIQESNALKKSLDYFEACLNEQIEKKRVIIEKPKWFGSFMNYILKKKGYNYTSISEIEKEYKREDVTHIKFLSSDLEQLAYSGLILYYKNDPDLNDVAWLDPSATLKHIYSKVLSKSSISNKKGIINELEFQKQIKDVKLIKMLSNQKVIYYDSFDKKYIVPGYLPLTSSESKIYELLTFDFIEPNFVLKFMYFIPFGLINQLICKYGENQSKKYYWRDQLLFTKDSKYKILIKLDFKNLEISVSIKSDESVQNIEKIKQQIFADILNLYWDGKELKDNFNDALSKINLDEINIGDLVDKKIEVSISENEFWFDYRSPEDMYLSIDNKYFIHHKTLESRSETKNKINAYPLDENRNIDFKHVKEQSSGIYKNFTTNEGVKKMKKIFISYSRKDVDYKNELKKHLNMLHTFDIADNWSCEEITIGKWDSQIQSELEESDLIIYMLSANFFSSKYILEKEVKIGIELINSNKEKNILCVIVSDFIGLDKLKNAIENSANTDLQDSLLNLSSYQYLPYDTIPNNVNNNSEEKIKSLKDHTNSNTIDKALTQITEKVLQAVSR